MPKIKHNHEYDYLLEEARLRWRDEAFARIEKMFGKTLSKIDLEDILLILSSVSLNPPTSLSNLPQ